MTDTLEAPMIQAVARGAAASVLPSAVQVKEPFALVIFGATEAHGRMHDGDREAWDRIAGHVFYHRADFTVTESYSTLSEGLQALEKAAAPKGGA